MSYKEQQEEELSAIESIYTDDEVVDVKRDYPGIELQLELNSAAPGSEPTDSDFSIGLHVKLPEKYPDEVPEIEIEDVDEVFDEDRIGTIKESLDKVASENVGMVMIFTIVSALQEEIGKLVEERKELAEKAIEEEKIKKETIENRRFQGTTVTVETFKAWKAKFDAEQKVLQDKAELERQAALAGKLTGRQQFLLDATLNLSDVALLDSANDVEIDESLFEEDIEGLEIEDDED